MNRVLGIIDTDRAYAGKLTERLSERRDLAFTALPFYEKQELIDYAKEHHLHLLIVGMELADEEILSLDADKILLLSGEEIPEEPGKGSDAGDGRDSGGCMDPDREGSLKTASEPSAEYQRIFRFQSVSEWVRRIREAVSEDLDGKRSGKGSGIEARGKNRIRGIFSPVAISGRDRVIREILTSRREREGRDRKILLITLASFSSLAPEEDSDQFDIADAYYFWKQNALEKHLPELIRRGEDFDYIPGVYFPEDLLVLSRDRLQVFLRDLAVCSGRDLIYVDFAAFGNDVSLIASLCEEQILPYYEQNESRNKVSRYEKYVTRSGHEDWLKKIVHYPLSDAD